MGWKVKGENASRWHSSLIFVGHSQLLVSVPGTLKEPTWNTCGGEESRIIHWFE